MDGFSNTDIRLPFLCPHCGKPLIRTEKVAGCESGHRFDRAKEGYWHLLPGNVSSHGDGKGMIAARHRLLESGCYAPLREGLCALLQNYAPHGGTLLDAGCGEGYYTEAAAAFAGEVVGIDLSKDALKLAGKRFRGRENAHFAVSSVYAMPLPERSFDSILSIFSPFAGEEFRRLLRPEGVLLSVIPEAKHLWEMKQILYERPYENQPTADIPDGFRLCEQVSLPYTVQMENPLLCDLFTMTPYYYRTPAAGKERLTAAPRLELTLSFRLLVYRALHPIDSSV